MFNPIPPAKKNLCFKVRIHKGVVKFYDKFNIYTKVVLLLANVSIALNSSQDKKNIYMNFKFSSVTHFRLAKCSPSATACKNVSVVQTFLRHDDDDDERMVERKIK